MSDENLLIWDNLKQVPAACLKKIGAGRLKGMHSIDPQWRLQAMTHQFGVCGFGWKYVVTNKWIEDGSDNQKIAFVDLDLFIKVDGEWSEAISGNGGSAFIAKEKSGMYTSAEAYKMATTNALGVAMKSIGVAADIYMGAFDGCNYADTSGATNAPVDKKEKQLENMRGTIIGLLDEKDCTDSDKRAIIKFHCKLNKLGVETLADMRIEELKSFAGNFENTFSAYLDSIK